MPAEDHTDRAVPHSRWRRVLAAVAVIAALLAAVPMLWPVPPLQAVMGHRELAADEDGIFLEIDGLDVYCRQSGPAGADCNIVLLHGFGASTFSWRDTLTDLGARCRAVAFDRPGFGFTERPMPGSWTGRNPYSAEYSADLTIRIMDELGMDRAILVAHSAGCDVATLAAARYPDRVSALVLEAPATLTAGGPPDWVAPLLRSPQLRRIGPLLARRISAGNGDRLIREAFYDRSKVTDDVIAGYRKPLRAEDWDRALWEVTAAPRAEIDETLLGSLDIPVLVVQPLEDRLVPPDDQARVAAAIAGADLIPLEKAGHVAHEELPSVFETIVFRFIDDLQDAGVP